MERKTVKMTMEDLRGIVAGCALRMMDGDKSDAESLVDEAIGIYGTYSRTSPKRFFREIERLSPDGKGMPSGHGMQKSAYLKACHANERAFALDEGVHGEQYGFADYRGGVIVFSTDVNSVRLSGNAFANRFRQILATLENRLLADRKTRGVMAKFNRYSKGETVSNYSIGNAFRGRYVDDEGNVFDENSTSVEIDGLSSDGLLRLAETIARVFRQETVLVKDFNTMKFYLADGHRRKESPDFSNINTKSAFAAGAAFADSATKNKHEDEE